MGIVLIVWISLCIGFVSGALWCAAFRSRSEQAQPQPEVESEIIALPIAVIERCARPTRRERARLRRNRAELNGSIVARVRQ